MIFSRIALITALSVCLVVASCSKKDVMQDEPLISPDSSSLLPGDVPTQSDTMGAGGVDGGFGEYGSEFKTAFFDYDSYSLRSDARSALKNNASWMKQNKTVTVQIEGHCDERGTTEYNLALGERRANSVRDYLIRLGVPKSRLSVISYGEERPADPGHDESAWSKNRRAMFVILSR